jgi:hypothetical protein
VIYRLLLFRSLHQQRKFMEAYHEKHICNTRKNAEHHLYRGLSKGVLFLNFNSPVRKAIYFEL